MVSILERKTKAKTQLVLFFKIQKKKKKNQSHWSMWNTKDPNPFHYPPLWLKLKCSEKCHFKLKGSRISFLSLCLSVSLSLSFFVLKEAQGRLRDMSFMSFSYKHFKRPQIKGSWVGWMLALGVPNMSSVVQSSKRIHSIFAEGVTCVCISESFSYMLLFWPILSPGCKSQPSVKGGEEEGRCVSSPWCSPAFRLTERNCEETCLRKHKEKQVIWIISFWKAHFYADGENASEQGLPALGLGSECHLVSVDLALLANVISVKRWRRNPCLVREHVYKAKFEVGIWQLPCGWDYSWNQIGLLFVQNCSLC